MSPMLLPSILMETALHQALRLDPSSRAGFQALGDTVVGIEIQGFGELFLHLEDPPRVRTAPVSAPTVWLRAPPTGWLQLAQGSTTVPTLRIEGNTELAAKLHRLITGLDLDWEEALAQRLGDIPAHFLAQRWRASLHGAEQLGQTLVANLREYLQEEAQQLPPRALLDDWLDEVDRTVMDTDRLTARVQRLEQALRRHRS